MDLEALAKKKKKWAFVLGAFGVTFYGAYRIYDYNPPSVVKKRQRLLKLFTALLSVAEMVSDSADALGILSKDLKLFLGSDSDQIPQSLKQLSKIAESNEFSESLTRIARALAVGVLRGCQDGGNGNTFGDDECFSDRVFDKLFSNAGSGFASVVVGSFARNMVVALCTELQGSELDQSVPKWVEVVCEDKCRELIGDFIRTFVSTALTVYLDKTTNVNTFDEFFSGLTHPKHEGRVRDMLASVCNGAVNSCIQTSYHVWSKNAKMASKIDDEDGFGRKKVRGKNEVMRKMVCVPRNRKFVLDVTGIVTFETVRSFHEFLVEKMLDCVKAGVDVVHQEVVDRGFETMRYVSDKRRTSAVTTLCLTLCLNILNSPWILTTY